MDEIQDIANKIEAMLIATPEPLSKKEISSRINADLSSTAKAIQLLRKRYEDTALDIKLYGRKYKIVVKEKYSELSYLYSELELTKGEMEILAYLFKNKKMYLSEAKRLRGLKAIQEISHLEKLGYLKLIKRGRRNELKLTKNFIKKFGKDIEKEMKNNINNADISVENGEDHQNQQAGSYENER